MKCTAFTLTALASAVVMFVSCSDHPEPLDPSAALAGEITTVMVTPVLDTVNSLGVTHQLTATAYDASNNPVVTHFTWQSLDTAIARVDGNGLVTTGRLRGLARFRATSEDGVSGIGRLRVRQVIKSVGFAIRRDTVNAVGATRQIVIAPLDSNNVAVEGTTQTWRSLDPAFASVSATGLVTAIAVTRFERPARILVTLSGVNIGSKTDTAFITIRQVAKTFTVSPDTVINAIGYTVQLTASATDSSDTAIPINWKSLDKLVLSVDETGLATSLKRGSGRIAVRAGTSWDTIAVESRQIAKTLTVTPSSASLEGGQTVTLTGELRDSNNVVVPGVYYWTSDDTNIATVTPAPPGRAATGEVTAVGAGVATITAVSRTGLTATSTITVTAAPVDGALHTWTGATSNDFAVAGNWSPGFVPASTDTVIIADVATQPVVGANTTVAKVVVNSGASLSVNTGVVLTVDRDLLVSGTVDGTGITRLNGFNANVQGTVGQVLVAGSYTVTAALDISTLLEVEGRIETDGNTITIDTAEPGVRAGSVVATPTPIQQPTRTGDTEPFSRAKKDVPRTTPNKKARDTAQ